MPRYLTFDCYDTLVQYSASKRACVTALVTRHSKNIDPDLVVNSQVKIEQELHLGPFISLSKVLRASLEQAFNIHHIKYEKYYGDFLENSVRFAPCFPETREVLTELAKKFRLVIISNSEPKIIDDNIAVIGAPIFSAVTAVETQCYKPDLALFQFVLKKLDCRPTELVHIAAGFYHDIEPCSRLGWDRIWINRMNHSGEAAYRPYEELENLKGLCELMKKR